MFISVVIPCFRSGNYVIDAVDSVLKQKGDHNLFEVIVVDDHNDDSITIDALNRLKTSYPDIVRVLTNNGDRGPGASRNIGVNYAKGDWIAFLDADDIYSEYSLDVRSNAAKLYPSCGWIGADFALWNDGEEPKEISYFNTMPLSSKTLKEAYSNNKPILFEKPINEFIENGLTNTNSSMVRKDLFCRVGGFDNSFRLQQDFHLFLRLANVSSFVFTPYICCFNRQHSNNSTWSELNTVHWRIKVFESLLSEYAFFEHKGYLKNKIATRYCGLCYSYRANGKFYKAIEMACRAILYKPLMLKNWKCLMAALLRKR